MLSATKNVSSGTAFIVENTGSTSYLGSYGWFRSDGATRGNGIIFSNSADKHAFGIGTAYTGSTTLHVGYVADYTTTDATFQETATLDGSHSIFQLTSVGAATFAAGVSATTGAFSSTLGSLTHTPNTTITSDLGSAALMWQRLYAAELLVETLVAQDTIATIGGRMLVGPTTTITADLASGGTTLTVKHNNLVNGDRVYLSSGGLIEWMAIASTPGGSAGAYTYTVTRGLDSGGTGHAWAAGSAVFDTGTTGNGFIDLYSQGGVLAGTGPTLVGNVRTGTTYSDVAPRWALGNLDGTYGYAATTYGFAAGVSTGAHVTVDATNGLRIRNATTDIIHVSATGAAGIQVATGTSPWGAGIAARYAFVPTIAGSQYGLTAIEPGGGTDYRYLRLDNVATPDKRTITQWVTDNGAAGHTPIYIRATAFEHGAAPSDLEYLELIATRISLAGTIYLTGTVALGANDLTMTGSIGSTGSRVTAGWFTDVTVSNAIAASITGSSASTTGNAATATALASAPSGCGANTYATSIAASGNLTCSSVTNASTTAATAATASTIVLRDASGNITGHDVTSDHLFINVTPSSGTQYALTWNSTSKAVEYSAFPTSFPGSAYGGTTCDANQFVRVISVDGNGLVSGATCGALEPSATWASRLLTLEQRVADLEALLTRRAP
jgi:hypothetical protein